jgi:hypothetical protein
MAAKTSAQRQQKRRDRLKAEKRVRPDFAVRPEHVELIKAYIKKLEEESC